MLKGVVRGVFGEGVGPPTLALDVEKCATVVKSVTCTIIFWKRTALQNRPQAPFPIAKVIILVVLENFAKYGRVSDGVTKC